MEGCFAATAHALASTRVSIRPLRGLLDHREGTRVSIRPLRGLLDHRGSTGQEPSTLAHDVPLPQRLWEVSGTPTNTTFPI